MVLAKYLFRTLNCKEAIDVEHIVHLVLPAGENSPKCGAYFIGIRLVHFEGSVDVAFVVASSLGIHEGATFSIADCKLAIMKQPCVYELLLNHYHWSHSIPPWFGRRSGVR